MKAGRGQTGGGGHGRPGLGWWEVLDLALWLGQAAGKAPLAGSARLVYNLPLHLRPASCAVVGALAAGLRLVAQPLPKPTARSTTLLRGEQCFSAVLPWPS